jgi:hypothetical protein
MDRFKLNNARFKEWEDTFLAGLTRREGWVVGHAATGSSAWNEISTAVGLSLFVGLNRHHNK